MITSTTFSAWLDKLMKDGGAVLRKRFNRIMSSAGIGNVYKKIDALPTGLRDKSFSQDVGAINDTLQRNRCLNVLLLGFLYERTTTGPTLKERHTQLKQVLHGTPAMATMRFRLCYLTLVRRWPLLLCVNNSRNISQSKKAITKRAEDLDKLHTEAAVTTEHLVAMLAS
jgi:hypothetical protein